MKFNIYLLYLFIGLTCQSQNFITSIPFLMKKNGDSFSYVDKSKDEAYLVISNGKKVRFAHYSNIFKIIDTLTTSIPEKRSKSIIGFSKTDTSVNLIWNSESDSKLFFQNVDLVTKKVTVTSKELELDHETFLQSFSTNEAFYCLSTVSKSNILKIYKFSNKNELEIKTIDISNTFTDSNNKETTIYGLFSESFNSSFESSFELQNIDVTLPNSLVICSKKRKAYLSNQNDLVLTFDNNSVNTQIIKIRLTNFTSEVYKVEKTGNQTEQAQSNSYFFEDNVYQFKIYSDRIFLSIKNLNGQTQKEYSTDYTSEINFKNSDFLCEWTNKSLEKSIENTEQFISKISDYRIGISCYNYNGKNLISFGGVSKKIKKNDEEDEVNNAYHGINLTPWYDGKNINPTGGGFKIIGNGGYINNNYQSSRNIISINSLFSKDFVLQSEKVNTFSTTKICSYLNGFTELKYSTIFSINNKAYIGYYNEGAKHYVIMKFEN